jgi:hypothetical protein
MINHVRTLLQNTVPAQSDEYVPEDFVPMEAPEAVQKVKRILWGRTPAYQFRIRQLMQLLHSTELEEHVLAKDPRVTYIPFVDARPGDDANLAEFIPLLEAELTADDYKVLFGDTEQEPNRTWLRLWMDHDQLAYRLGGLILAVADATERARKWATPQ